MSLSEIISKCGDEFGSLTKNNSYNLWLCWGQHTKLFEGKTPEEAVNKLLNEIQCKIKKN